LYITAIKNAKTAMILSEIAKAFSLGQFQETFPHLTENIVWTIVGENEFAGKEAVIRNCEQIAAYFRSVTTNFTLLNCIVDQNLVAINGAAEFIRDGQRIAFVSSCDLYEFDNRQKLSKITSYCIQSQ